MKLSRVNNLLLAAIIAVNGYIIVVPLMPAVTWWWQQRIRHVSDTLAAQLHQPGNAGHPQYPQDNRLVIPRIGLNDPIIDGPDARSLNKGPWHRPLTSTPAAGSNTVIAAHRFTYTNPRGDFYHLDKVRTGDEIGVFWQHKEYLYTVTGVKEVGPNAIEIEAPTPKPQLTLYTCTPLWLPKDRLVVVASLKEIR